MEELAQALGQFRSALRLEGFDEREAFSLTTTYLASLLRAGAAVNEVVKSEI